MRIPNDVRKCIAYIGFRKRGDPHEANEDRNVVIGGTGFLLSRTLNSGHSLPYIVTARHVIEKIASLADPDDRKVIVRLNLLESEEAYDFETNIADWFYHPAEPETDVAVLRYWNLNLDLSREPDIRPFPATAGISADLITSLEIGIGDEVFVPGLFVNHHGRRKNLPIVRIGTIAAMPEERVKTALGFIDAYLIESRSIGGLSGSPVFVHLDTQGVIPAGKPRETNAVFGLLGLMHGHFDIPVGGDDFDSSRERINMGIGIVVPFPKIAEVLEQDMNLQFEQALAEFVEQDERRQKLIASAKPLILQRLQKGSVEVIRMAEVLGPPYYMGVTFAAVDELRKAGLVHVEHAKNAPVCVSLPDEVS